MSDPLPDFPYFPDPVGDGSIEACAETCFSCKRSRGFICTNSAYGADIPDGARFCPWCVADGSAHSRYGASFHDVELGASGEATRAVSYRTPRFLTWQDWAWPSHCGDAAIYLGQPNGKQLRANPEAHQALHEELRRWDWGRDEAYVEEFIDGLGGSCVAYLFKCRQCHEQLVVWDQD
jgi:uncharacterized protein CbrC (UPF0167 family)